MLLFTALAVCFASQLAFGDPARRLELLSRLQMMSEGAYTTREWNDVTRELDDILLNAQQQQAWDEFIEIKVIQAKVQAARGDQRGAMNVMQETLEAFKNADVPAIKKVYFEIASLHAQAGNERGVTEIMNAFKSGRHFDAQSYGFSGGAGPGDPIVVTRPQAGAGASISMTAMNVQRARARYAPGNSFPEINVVGWNGSVINPSHMPSTALLIDIWAPGMTVWRRNMGNLIALYERYNRAGLQILGLSIDPNESRARDFVAQNNITWPQANAPHALTRELGIFGEAANFLLDRNGVIIGRNLSGAELDAAIREILQR